MATRDEERRRNAPVTSKGLLERVPPVQGPKQAPAPEPGMLERGGKVAKGLNAVVNSGTGRALQGALTGSAFRSFGKAFDGGGYTPRGMRPDTSYLDNWEQAGNVAQNALVDRWHKSEFENFQKEFVKPFQEKVQELATRGKYLNQQLLDLRWTESNGEMTLFDIKNPADMARVSRLQGQIQSEMMTKATEAHIGLNTDAATKYDGNPIVENMLAQMMAGTSGMIDAQFNKSDPMGQAEQVSNIDRNKAAARQSNAQAAGYEKQLATPDVDDVNTALSTFTPEQFENWANGKGKEAYGSAAQEFKLARKQEFIKEWRLDNDIDAANFYDQDVQAAQQEMLENRFGQIERLAMGDLIEDRKGKAARTTADVDRTGSGKRGLMPEPAAPVEPAVTTRQTPAEIRDKRDKWEVLALDAADTYMDTEAGADKTKEEVVAWTLDEWYENAIRTGTDLTDGRRVNQIADLTTDPDSKATKSYYLGVRKHLEKVAKKFIKLPIDDAEGRPRRPSVGRGLTGLAGKAGRGILNTLGNVIPDSLSDVGETVYREELGDNFTKPVPGKRSYKN